MAFCIEIACCALKFTLHQRGLVQKKTIVGALHTGDGVIFTIMGRGATPWRRLNGKTSYKPMHIRLINRAPSCITTGDISKLADEIQDRMNSGAMREYEVSE